MGVWLIMGLCATLALSIVPTWLVYDLSRGLEKQRQQRPERKRG